MTARILDGKAIAAALIQDIQLEVEERRAAGKRVPGLAVILLGGDPASSIYVRNKRLACAKAGVLSISHDLPASTSQSDLLALIDQLNDDPTVDGILVQAPLPEHIDDETVIERIHPDKDVDGFHPYNIGRLAVKKPTLRSCTPYGVMHLLETTGEALRGKHAVVVGASNHVGRPMALELLLAGCTVTVCHSATRDLPVQVAQADIVVAAVGRPEMVKGEWIKEGAMVIDIGINRLDDGRICGDVEFSAAKERAGWISPVPGGVGPMTVATLLSNTLEAALKHP
ncbi:MAG: bifunctional methylenetetrahydrofolate dehydrogenase/methenyltetrahydrofolate cyclohydrolase FolD [Pseudomonadota bacterium]|nr:bifunctional methylenetetrahydrofolate dehydrogenase/methenyltetrahydrofolate cyclohydrolase FolD [Pseudomonadota bacterium]MDP1903104.1 bifunctional methylenetetrahydrofolate dehydrogenase/methenyltetrahydrofolate cyclohydrolase FolD [Pseudomonadota bacterium]MDP2353094.1 bifunctional methylenetetrahydrofolate dehydrogenase/methenyltetrahydrofolate cyclohydrolase FolD [Pseudomonadota bacterium]